MITFTYKRYHKLAFNSEDCCRFLRVKGKLDLFRRKQGTWIYYYSNGDIRAVLNYKNDIPHGQGFKYQRNRNLLVNSVNYDNGKYHGVNIRYHNSGRPHEISTFQHGVLHGKSTIYYDVENQIRYEFQYDKGNLIEFKHFNLNGVLLKQKK